MIARPPALTASLSRPSVPLPLRFFDCLLVVAFLPFALLAGLPVPGALAGAVVWLAARALGVLIDVLAARNPDPRVSTGMIFAGGMLRPLLVGLSILAIGRLGEREDGLTAALLVLVAFTIYLALSFILRPQRNPTP